MSIVLMLPPELEAVLHTHAANQGKAVEAIALEILSQVLIKQQDAEQPSLLKLAALSAIDDYTPGSEILAFEAIDGEDFQGYEAV
jgi:plasmid stability protein